MLKHQVSFPCYGPQDLRKLRRLTSSGTALLAGLNSSGKVVMPAHCCTAAQLLSVQKCNSCRRVNLMTLLSDGSCSWSIL